MRTNPTDQPNRDQWLLAVLKRLLALEPGDLSAAMTEAAHQVAEVLGADKVDVFLYAQGEDALVAEGTSDTPMGRRQHEVGLDRLSIANGGRAVRVFESGESYRAEHADQDPVELPDVVRKLGVRSTLAVPLQVTGARRGVLLASSATPGAFAQGDLDFLQAVAHWVGLTVTRLAQTEMIAAQAAAHGLQVGADQPGLTARQRDVAGLVRQGLTNTEIAEQLVLEPGTVANHVASILDRLGFRSRSQIAVWAAERGVGYQPPASQQA
jgi:DNA-binding CsgD family transcriptional regulator